MLRPAKLLALLDWSDLEPHSGRRGRLPPSLPEASHLHLESGMTTQSSWGRTVAGLPPAGVLPLQAARSVPTLVIKDCYLYHMVVLSIIYSTIWYGSESLRQSQTICFYKSTECTILSLDCLSIAMNSDYHCKPTNSKS